MHRRGRVRARNDHDERQWNLMRRLPGLRVQRDMPMVNELLCMHLRACGRLVPRLRPGSARSECRLLSQLRRLHDGDQFVRLRTQLRHFVQQLHGVSSRLSRGDAAMRSGLWGLRFRHAQPSHVRADLTALVRKSCPR